MINNVKLVNNNPKLPLLSAEKILMPIATNMIGYSKYQSTLGTVIETVVAIIKFNSQLAVSKHNLTGCACQSFLTKSTVLCQSILIKMCAFYCIFDKIFRLFRYKAYYQIDNSYQAMYYYICWGRL